MRRLKELEEENREGRETMPLVVSELEDGLRVPLNEPKTYLGEGAYPITDATFRNNALLFEGGQVAVVDLLDKHGASGRPLNPAVPSSASNPGAASATPPTSTAPSPNVSTSTDWRLERSLGLSMG